MCGPVRPGLCAVSGCIQTPLAGDGHVRVTARSRVLTDATVRATRLRCRALPERRPMERCDHRPPVTECRWCVRDPFGLTDCLVRWSPAFRPRARGKICNLARRGALSARDGPRPSVEGARHCPSDHGGKREATLMIHVVHQRRSPLVSAGGVDRSKARARKTKWLVPISCWFLRLPG